MTYILDTDTLIFLIRGLKITSPRTAHEKELRRKADQILASCRTTASDGNILALSSITAAELEYGARRSLSYETEASAVQKILGPFQRLDFDGFECAKRYGEIRHSLESAGLPIGAMDLLIAAHAQATASILVSNNKSHFSRIKDIQLESWTD